MIAKETDSRPKVAAAKQQPLIVWCIAVTLDNREHCDIAGNSYGIPVAINAQSANTANWPGGHRPEWACMIGMV